MKNASLKYFVIVLLMFLSNFQLLASDLPSELDDATNDNPTDVSIVFLFYKVSIVICIISFMLFSKRKPGLKSN
jgi:hypothetical protein